MTAQPYSLGPLTRWSPPFPAGTTLPAEGTLTRMDGEGPELDILMCFVAPRDVQQEARRRGERALMMRYAPGLREALADPALWPRTSAVIKAIKGR